VGHSARSLYEHLLTVGVAFTPKDFACGFRVEHPQEVINSIQYGEQYAAMVQRGKGLLPVADYRLAVEVPGAGESRKQPVFSFCMCPGGQIVPTSTQEDELCVNGMSFSARGSKWANSALVVGVQADAVHELAAGWEDLTMPPGQEALVGVEFQRRAERRAAVAGGGGLVVPVQTIPDFLQGRLSDAATLPTSSYRLGVKSARLDLLYPPPITHALKEALRAFDRRMPGFVTDQGLLHGASCARGVPPDPAGGNWRCSHATLLARGNKGGEAPDSSAP
jgi:uncharacterized FAD-dependent dehydrogenase